MESRSLQMLIVLIRTATPLTLLAVASVSPSAARPNGCPYPTQYGFHCSDAQTHCDRNIVLMVCSLAGSSECCGTTGTHVDCCGSDAQNSAESGSCNGNGGCGKGGLIADPKTGRIARACFGEFIYQKSQPPTGPPQLKSSSERAPQMPTVPASGAGK
jgi:hypothetical protein